MTIALYLAALAIVLASLSLILLLSRQTYVHYYKKPPTSPSEQAKDELNKPRLYSDGHNIFVAFPTPDGTRIVKTVKFDPNTLKPLGEWTLPSEVP